MASQKLTALTAAPSLATTDLLYTVTDPAGTPTSYKTTIQAVLNLAGAGLGGSPAVCQGRLTTESGVPVSTSDRTSQSTLYFTPYNGNQVGLYSGTAWSINTFTERSLALSLTSGKPYDIFLYDNAGTLTLEALVWTNDTTRATALTTQDGIYVKSGATTRRYLGTIYASGSNVTEDSAANRFVWNHYNRMPRPMQCATETTDSWNYTTATWRQANANPANQLNFVAGIADAYAEARVQQMSSSSSQNHHANGIGIDSTSANSAPHFGSAGALQVTTSAWRGYPSGVGKHFIAWLEYAVASGTCTWYGDFGQPDAEQGGISGMVWG